MGNHRFRLSDMMPNAWFYKLKDMSKSSNRNHNPTNSSHPHHPTKKSSSQKPRKSITIHHNTYTTSHNYNNPKSYSLEKNTHTSPFDPHRKSSKKRPKTLYMPSPTQQQLPPPASNLDDFPSSPDQNLSEFDYSDSSRSCKLLSCHDNDIIIDVGSDFSPELPQVRTKPAAAKPDHSSLEKKCQFISGNSNRNSRRSTPSRRSVSRVKIRGKAVGRKSVRGGERKALFGSESYAVVKASFDPESDFRESMMEMIVENNIKASKDLEDLLACYLSLNSNQYHQLIIKAFEQIWFNEANQLPH